MGAALGPHVDQRHYQRLGAFFRVWEYLILNQLVISRPADKVLELNFIYEILQV